MLPKLPVYTHTHKYSRNPFSDKSKRNKYWKIHFKWMCTKTVVHMKLCVRGKREKYISVVFCSFSLLRKKWGKSS